MRRVWKWCKDAIICKVRLKGQEITNGNDSELITNISEGNHWFTDEDTFRGNGE